MWLNPHINMPPDIPTPDTHISNFQGKIAITPTTEHHTPPDTGPAFIRLKNMAGWGERQDVEHMEIGHANGHGGDRVRILGSICL